MNLNLSVEQMLDLVRYPIADRYSADFDILSTQCRNEYEATGMCMLPGFVTANARQMLADEANALSGHAYFCRDTHNAYLVDDHPEWEADDVKRKPQETFVGSVPYDLLSADSNLRRIYNWDPLKEFIGSVLGKNAFYRFADPLGACSINVFVEGGEHGWHFDESEFTVTLMLQPPESGGVFEFVPQIRGLADEEEIVRNVLDGDRSGVRELPFTAGTLLIFAGRQTIHRVTRVHGNTPRLVPIFCYSEIPDQQNSEAVRKLFWGRTGDELRP